MTNTSGPDQDEGDDVSIPMTDASEEYRHESPAVGPGLTGRLIAGVVVLLLAVGIMLYPEFGGEPEPAKPSSTTPVSGSESVPLPALPPAKDIPRVTLPADAAEPLPTALTVDTVEEPESAADIDAAAEPDPANDDELLREQMQRIGLAEPLTGLAGGDFLMQRMVALVDGTSRGLVLRKLLPLPPLSRSFSTEVSNGELVVSPESYSRYDSYVVALTKVDTSTAVYAFHKLRPLLERTYGELGLAPEAFDNAVIRTLDNVIATPVLEQLPVLERKSVMYTYADPQLEALPPLQKQLLRMGPDNLRRLQQKAAELREALLQPPPG